MRTQTARILLGGGTVVAAAGISAAIVGHPLGWGFAGPGFGAMGMGGGFLADARGAAAEADLQLSLATPGGMRRVWRSDGFEHHLLVEATARAFFVVTLAALVLGLALAVAGVEDVPSWTYFWLFAFGWGIAFPACIVYVKRHAS